MKLNKEYGMHCSHSIYHPLPSSLTLTFQRKSCHLLCFSTATWPSFFFFPVSEVVNGNVLSNEQHCLWRCGNVFVVILNHSLKGKKSRYISRCVSSLYRNQLIYSDLKRRIMDTTYEYLCGYENCNSLSWQSSTSPE